MRDSDSQMKAKILLSGYFHFQTLRKISAQDLHQKNHKNKVASTYYDTL